MARLLILREDLRLEIHGILAGPFDWLDGNGIKWRHTYFFRNFSKTMQEISRALQQVQGIPEFQRAFKKRFTSSEQKVFKDFCKEIQGAGELIKEVRNSAGGHINHTVLARALKTIGPDWTGFWDRPFDPTERFAHTHHPFVDDLVVSMFRIGGRPANLREKDVAEALKTPGVMAGLQFAIPHIDSLFELYVSERQLL